MPAVTPAGRNAASRYWLPRSDQWTPWLLHRRIQCQICFTIPSYQICLWSTPLWGEDQLHSCSPDTAHRGQRPLHTVWKVFLPHAGWKGPSSPLSYIPPIEHLWRSKTDVRILIEVITGKPMPRFRIILRHFQKWLKREIFLQLVLYNTIHIPI